MKFIGLLLPVLLVAACSPTVWPAERPIPVTSQPASPLVISHPRPAEPVRLAAPGDLCSSDWLLIGGQGAGAFTEYPALGPVVLHFGPPWYSDNAGEPHRAEEVPLPEGVDLSVSIEMCLSLGGGKSLGGLTRFFADGAFAEYNWFEIDVACGGADYDAFMHIWRDAVERKFYLNDDETALYLRGANAFLQWTRLPGGYVCRDFTSGERGASLPYPDYTPTEPLHHLSTPDTALCGSRWQLAVAQVEGQVSTYPAIASVELEFRPIDAEIATSLGVRPQPGDLSLYATYTCWNARKSGGGAYRLEDDGSAVFLVGFPSTDEGCGEQMDSESNLFWRAMHVADRYGLNIDETKLYLLGPEILLEWERVPNDGTCE